MNIDHTANNAQTTADAVCAHQVAPALNSSRSLHSRSSHSHHRKHQEPTGGGVPVVAPSPTSTLTEIQSRNGSFEETAAPKSGGLSISL